MHYEYIGNTYTASQEVKKNTIIFLNFCHQVSMANTFHSEYYCMHAIYAMRSLELRFWSSTCCDLISVLSNCGLDKTLNSILWMSDRTTIVLFAHGGVGLLFFIPWSLKWNFFQWCNCFGNKCNFMDFISECKLTGKRQPRPLPTRTCWLCSVQITTWYRFRPLRQTLATLC